ncbi:MAG: ATP-binding protein [Clostridiales Family XIII bacterium]|nr:ATP-binding protein [Clostridiales Family XIII bacterium]
MIKRESYMRRIRDFIDKDVIKIMTGIRRSGKSVMLQLIQEELFGRGVSQERVMALNFEDADIAPLRDVAALHGYIKKRIGKTSSRTYLFFDEIQEVVGWERCVNSLRVKFDVDIYVTGSNANLLSKEYATYLGGRYVSFVIYPFSFSEFVEMRSGMTEGLDYPHGYPYDYSLSRQDLVTRSFGEYVQFGGMPFLANLGYKPEPSNQYLKDLYSSVVLKDIVKRNNVRNVDLLERIISYVLSGIGRTFSARSISNYFKSEGRNVPTETVLGYLKYCEDAFLLYKVSRNDLKGKKILTVNQKYYAADHGLCGAIIGSAKPDIELVLENIVYLELAHRGYGVTVGKFGDLEVDFIAVRGAETLYVQVAYLLATPDVVTREFRVLELIKDNFPKYVVSADEFDRSQNGIIHQNIRTFLLAGRRFEG